MKKITIHTHYDHNTTTVRWHDDHIVITGWLWFLLNKMDIKYEIWNFLIKNATVIYKKFPQGWSSLTKKDAYHQHWPSALIIMITDTSALIYYRGWPLMVLSALIDTDDVISVYHCQSSLMKLVVNQPSALLRPPIVSSTL